MSDAEVYIIHDYKDSTDDNVKVDKAHKMYSWTMSSSYCQVQTYKIICSIHIKFENYIQGTEIWVKNKANKDC
jgi:hypothetical protein